MSQDLKREINILLNKVEKIIDEYDLLLNHQEFILDNEIDNIKLEIDLQREELIQKIHKISNKMIEKLDEYNKNCKNNIKNLENLTNSNKTELEIIKKEFLNKKQLIDLIANNETDELIKTFCRLENDMHSYKVKLKSYENELKLNKKCFFDPSKHLFGQLFINDIEFRSSNSTGNLLKSTFDISGDSICLVELLENGNAAIGCENGKIKIFNINLSEFITILVGHVNKITSMKLGTNSTLISGSSDSTIKLWNLNLNQCIHTLIGHFEDINDVCIIENNKLASASSDKTIKIWNIDNFESETCFIGHTDCVKCIKLNSNNQLVSCSHDGTIKIWSLITYACEKTLENENNEPVESIELNSNDDIISTSYSRLLKIWSAKTGQCLNILDVFNNKSESLRFSKLLSDELIVTIQDFNYGYDKKYWELKLISLVDGKCIFKTCHYGFIYDIKLLKNGDLIYINYDESKNEILRSIRIMSLV